MDQRFSRKLLTRISDISHISKYLAKRSHSNNDGVLNTENTTNCFPNSYTATKK